MRSMLGKTHKKPDSKGLNQISYMDAQNAGLDPRTLHGGAAQGRVGAREEGGKGRSMNNPNQAVLSRILPRESLKTKRRN